ncbi:MAG: response regulator transcription factor [Bdellovibrionales bacterium]|nr:response regulator transcription factor [Bdellovibrionales bacterium]
MKDPLRSTELAPKRGLSSGDPSMSVEPRRKILIVDDELAHAEILSELLSERFDVLQAADGETAIQLAIEALPDLVMLDIRLPRRSGLDVCSSLRNRERTRDIPIIVMTGNDSQETRITAYRKGADDYLCKPFSFDEVIARIESKIRRLDERSLTKNSVTLGNLLIDRAKMEAQVSGMPLALSALEFRLLEYFAQHRDEILSRDKILKDIWKDAVVTARTVDTHVSFLRKKLSGSTYSIRTLYGAGYILKPRG